LKNLVEVFVETAHPVGSKALAERLDFALSSASIRNTMAELEEFGLIEKPHTSAGRVPTKEGFRYYVAALMSPVSLSDQEKTAIEASLSSFYTDSGELLEGVARTLAHLSNQLGIILAPHGQDLKLFRIDYIPTSPVEVSLVVSTTNGIVKSVPLRFAHNIDFRRLSVVIDLINERLSGRTLGEIRANIERRFEDVLSIKEAFLLRLVSSADFIFHFDEEESLYYSGTSGLLQKPEFSKGESLRGLFSLLENRSNLSKLLAVSRGEPLNIAVSGSIEEMSIVTYEFNNEKSRGIIGIIGPIRMDYSKASSLLIYAGNALSKAFRN